MPLDPKVKKAIATNRDRADAIAVGIVVAVGPSPGVWSGLVETYQEATYRVKTFLPRKADLRKPDRLTVRHPLVAGSLTADAAQPRLNMELFRVDSELVLFLTQRKDTWATTDENYGVLRMTAEIEELLRQ